MVTWGPKRGQDPRYKGSKRDFQDIFGNLGNEGHGECVVGESESVLFSLGEGAVPFSLELGRCGRCQEDKRK